MPLATKPLDFITNSTGPSLETVDQILPDTLAVHPLAHNVPSVCETMMTSIRRKMKKSVQFRTVTVYYFPRAQGYSSIPNQDGPTLGMSDKHVLVETFDLMERLDLGINRNHPSPSECPLSPTAFSRLTSAGNLLSVELTSVDPLSKDPHLPAKRMKLVGATIHPVTLRQRRKLLRDAGVVKIDAMEEAEAREIRVSRTLCGCNCKGTCRPDTCLCSRSEIPCQVDSGSFPCACSEFGCGNPAGRLQFDLVQVRKQRFLQLARLQVDNAVDQGDPALDVVNIELIISPAKRTKLSNPGPTRKRIVTKKRPLRRGAGKLSTRIPEKLESESLPESKENTIEKEAEHEALQRGNSFDDADTKNAFAENRVASSEGNLITESRIQFSDPVRESLIESALKYVGSVLETLQKESNATSIEDAIFPRPTTGFDLEADNDLGPEDDVDLEDDLDLNCLKLLVIGNENNCLGGLVDDLQLRNGCELNYLGSNRESKSECGFSLESKNDLQAANVLQSPDDLDLDLGCDVSLVNCSSPWPTVSHDAASKGPSVESRGARSDDIVETDFSNVRCNPNTVNNVLQYGFNINPASCSRKVSEQGSSCRSFLTRFSPKHLRKPADPDLCSQVTENSEGHSRSQGHGVGSEGHITKSQSHHTDSEGRVTESHCQQGHFCDNAAEVISNMLEEVSTMSEVSSMSEEVSSMSEGVPSSPPSTLEEESLASKGEGLIPSQISVSLELRINTEDDLIVVACAGSPLETSSVGN